MFRKEYSALVFYFISVNESLDDAVSLLFLKYATRLNSFASRFNKRCIIAVVVVVISSSSSSSI